MKFYEDDRIQSLHDVFPHIRDSNGQINLSIIRSTSNIVAWHKHEIQTDYWCCIKGSLKIGLVENNILRWEYLSDKNFRIIEIKPNIYHGYIALEPNSILLYYLDHQYNPNDEYKIKPGYFGESWSIENK